MLNRKILEVLSRLPEVKKKRLRAFLTSPYFNYTSHAENIVRLYDLIIRYNADEGHPALSKETVFNVFFPDKRFQENVKSPLDSLTSELFRLIRLFLAQTEMERENGDLYEHLSLARFYRKYGLEDRYWQTMETMRKIQNASRLRDARYYLDQFRIEEEELAFRGLYNTFEDGMNLNAVHRNLDLYYSILKLEFTFVMEYQTRFTQVENRDNTALIEKILTLTEDNGPLDIPINRIYHLLISLLHNPEPEESFTKLEDMLDKYEPFISVERYRDFKTCYRFLWHLRYYKSGDSFSRRHIFTMYQKDMDKGYFYYDGLIPHTVFRNLVLFALLVGEFEWVKNFLDNHPPERIGGTRYPAEILSLNWAEYFFHLKKYEEAQQKLVYRPFENPAVGILVDLLLIKIYYETQSELLEPRMKALDQKVRRSRFSSEVKDRYHNFLKKLDRVIKYGWQTKSPKRARLIEEIKATHEIIAREWLLEKLGVE